MSTPLATPAPGLPVGRRLLKTLSLVTACLLVACAAPQPQDHAQEQPALDLRRYFNGPLVAHGMFTDRQGHIQRRFTVQLQGRWQGEHGVLEEDFVYNDGTKQRRVWRIEHLGKGRYRGLADDVVGEAEGMAAGNVLRWRYTLALPVDGRVWHVQFNDWMVLMNDQVMLNRAQMSKFGLHLGDVTLSFDKR